MKTTLTKCDVCERNVVPQTGSVKLGLSTAGVCPRRSGLVSQIRGTHSAAEWA